MTKLEKRLEVLWKNQNPFVVYRLPKSKEIHIFFQEENQLHKTDDFSESGFVMTSFESLASHSFIPNSKSERFPKPEVQDFKSDPVVFPEDETRKSRFIELVKKAQSEIAQGHIKKVVLSRSIDLKTEENPSTLFLALENKYQDALTYLWHHPLVGTWLGATPEQFIEASSKSTLTMALAGTQIYTPNKNPHWSSKEKEEQALVTQQVLSDLKTLFKEKGSKFFGYAFPVLSEDDVKDCLEVLKKKHHSARHFCYAYQIGVEHTQYRAHDDGEPNNSAGLPIYGQIQSFEVTNTLIVFVRYFGGTKLGAGGLISAYKKSAQLALTASDIIEQTINVQFKLTFNYD